MSSLLRLFCLILSLMTTLPCTAREWTWARRDGGGDNEFARALEFAPNGEFYVTGPFIGETRIGDSVWQSSDDRVDTFLALYDDGGKPLWVRRIAGPEGDVADDLCVDPKGNVVLCGRYSESCTFADTTLHSPNDDPVIYAAKYSISGELLWARIVHDNSKNVNGPKLAIDAAGAIYLASNYYDRTLIGDSLIVGRESQPNLLISKLSPEGEAIWFRSFGGKRGRDEEPGDLPLSTIAVDPEGNTVIAARFRGHIRLGDSTIVAEGSKPDPLLFALDSKGAMRWIRLHKPLSDNLLVYSSIDFDSEGNFYATANFLDSALIGPFTIMSQGMSDVLIAKFDREGEALFVRSGGGPDADFSGRLRCRDGSCIMAGSYQGPAYFDGDTLPDPPSMGMYVAAYDYQGNILWTQHGDYSEGTLSVADLDRRSDGRLVFGGQFRGAISFGATRLIGDPIDGNANDVFLAGMHFASTSVPSDEDKPPQLMIHPHPVLQNCELVLNDLAPGSVRIDVYDPTGRLLMLDSRRHATQGTFRTTLDLSALAPGGYVLRLETAAGLMSRQLLVLR